ncbi:hypothetical protein B0H10DRAFT_2243620 [Mycena sp. CBHHK59/15]|nr:hypothetical protein B0H10DRAFT_2243620 [Mycena sp. CBHHK59/15]
MIRDVRGWTRHERIEVIGRAIEYTIALQNEKKTLLDGAPTILLAIPPRVGDITQRAEKEVFERLRICIRAARNASRRQLSNQAYNLVKRLKAEIEEIRRGDSLGLQSLGTKEGRDLWSKKTGRSGRKIMPGEGIIGFSPTYVGDVNEGTDVQAPGTIEYQFKPVEFEPVDNPNADRAGRLIIPNVYDAQKEGEGASLARLPWIPETTQRTASYSPQDLLARSLGLKTAHGPGSTLPPISHVFEFAYIASEYIPWDAR